MPKENIEVLLKDILLKLNDEEDKKKDENPFIKKDIKIQEDETESFFIDVFDEDEPKYKEVKKKNNKEELNIKKDIIIEKAYNDLLLDVLNEVDFSASLIEEENKEKFDYLYLTLKNYVLDKESIFKNIAEVDQDIFNEEKETL